MSFSHDTKLSDICAKVKTGERLSLEDGVALFNTTDLNALGKLADTVRRQKHGRTTYFNVNRHFNPTNVCYVDCKFCGEPIKPNLAKCPNCKEIVNKELYEKLTA